MAEKPFVVAMSGDPLSGKSATIKALIALLAKLSKTTGITVRIAAGSFFRNLATAAGITVGELTNLAEDPENTIETLRSLPDANKEYFDTLGVDLEKSIDVCVDEYILSEVEKETERLTGVPGAIIIVDSRIAGLLMKRRGDHVYNVRFTVKPEIAAKRLLGDAGNRKNEIDEEADFKTSLELITTRKDKDRRRFIRLYSNDIADRMENLKVDMQNPQNYDLIIDTSGVSIDNVVDVLHNGIKLAQRFNGRSDAVMLNGMFSKEWMSAKYIATYRTQCDRPWHFPTEMVKVVKVKGNNYALSGTEHVNFVKKQGRMLEEKTGTECGYRLVPMEVLAEDDEMFCFFDETGKMQLFTAKEFVEKFFAKSEGGD